MSKGLTVLLVNTHDQAEYWRDIAADQGYDVDRVVSASGECAPVRDLTVGKLLEAKNAYRGRHYGEIFRALEENLVSYGHAVVLNDIPEDDEDLPKAL